jgi:hypothetical protein
MSIDNYNTSNGATGSADGKICFWSLETGKCLFEVKSSKQQKEQQNQYKLKDENEETTNEAIVKIEIINNIVISMSANQMCIWSWSCGELLKEFTFFSPSLDDTNLCNSSNNSPTDLNIASGELNQFNGSQTNSFVDLVKSLFSGGKRALSPFSLRQRNQQKTINSLHDDFKIQLDPLMCLYSPKILITSVHSSLFIWNIHKGELIKKLNILKPISTFESSHNNTNINKNVDFNINNNSNSNNNNNKVGNHYDNHNQTSLNNLVQIGDIKSLKIIEQFKYNYNLMMTTANRCYLGSSNSTTTTNSRRRVITNLDVNQCINCNKQNFKKILVITDSTDTFYAIKLPSYIFH